LMKNKWEKVAQLQKFVKLATVVNISTFNIFH
jgi:hypothetical protein